MAKRKALVSRKHTVERPRHKGCGGAVSKQKNGTWLCSACRERVPDADVEPVKLKLAKAHGEYVKEEERPSTDHYGAVGLGEEILRNQDWCKRRREE